MDKWELFKEIQSARLTPNQYRVLMCYWHHSNNETLYAWPGTTMVANSCQMGFSTVRRTRSQLEDLGWLMRDGVKETGKYKGCLYFEVCLGKNRAAKDYTRPSTEQQESYEKANGLRVVSKC